MASNERIRKYLDAGSMRGQITRARAEEIVRELVSAGDIRREQAQEWVDNLVERSRKSSEHVLELVRREVAAQLKKIDTGSLEHIANQVSELLKRSADAGRSATKDATKQATKTAKDTAKAGRAAAEKVIPGVAKKKKAPARKVAAAKKAPAKKAPAKKVAAAKKAPAQKATAAKKAAKRASS
jgi:colicin import membrane protein